MPSSRPHLILIDGQSGVGKTSLAALIASALGATTVHLDDFYPGWGGLEPGRDAVIEEILWPLHAGRVGRSARWDWVENARGEDFLIAPTEVVIIEGCGISTPESRALADTVIWVECPDAVRLERLRARDGSRFAAELPRWDQQVETHIRENRPRESATVVVTT